MKGNRAAFAAKLFEQWDRSRSSQRAIKRALDPYGIRLTSYRVLEAADAVQRKTGDAFAQTALADEASLGKVTVSRAVRELIDVGLLDPGIDGIDGRMHRIVVTQEGERLLTCVRPIVEAVATALAGHR